jgi:hypothetical protein
MAGVQLARLIKLGGEAVGDVGPLAVEIVENVFEVLLSLSGA